MLSLISNILKLSISILTEIFARKRRAREKQEAFELSEKLFYEIVEDSLKKLQQTVVDSNAQINDIEEQMRNDAKR